MKKLIHNLTLLVICTVKRMKVKMGMFSKKQIYLSYVLHTHTQSMRDTHTIDVPMQISLMCIKLME